MTSKRDAAALDQKTALIATLQAIRDAQDRLIEALYTCGPNHPHTYAAEDALHKIYPSARIADMSCINPCGK